MVEEFLVAQNGEGAEDEGEEFGDAREGVEEEGYVGPQTGCVVGMEEGAGEVFDSGVGGGGYGVYGEHGLGEGFGGGEHNWGDECTVFD